MMMVGWLMCAVAVQAAVIATDDFSGGTIGNELDGVAVQSGSGIWTKSYSDGYTGSMAPLVFSAEGAGLPSGTSGGNAAIEDNYSLYKTVQVSTTFSVGSSKANNPQVTVGFYESINKGYLQNLSIDDLVSIRFLTGGPNEGKFIWGIRDEGTLISSTYNGGTVAFSSNDLVRLTLSYDLQTGLVSAEAYNVTQDSVINSSTITVLGLNAFNYAGVGVSAAVADAADPLYFDSIQVEGEARPLDGVIASDDFTGGTNDLPVLGAVQTGIGIWADTTVNPELVYGIDGARIPTNAASNGGLALEGDYSAYTNSLSISTVFSVRENKPTNPNVSIAFLETIDKGVLQNVDADDQVGVKMLTSGPNEGKLVWKIRDEGNNISSVYNGSVVSFGSNDLVRLTLTYDIQNEEVSAEAYNLTQDSVINTASITVTNDISGFNYSGIGVINADPAGLENPLYIRSFEVTADSGFTVTVPVLTFSSSASGISLSASNLTVATGWTNYLQVSENLVDMNGWSNLVSVSGTAATNWIFSYDKPAQFFRIISAQ